MTQTHSRLRQQAESAFAKEQSQFRARNHLVEKRDQFALARAQKTSCLREARLAKEAEDRARAIETVTQTPAHKA